MSRTLKELPATLSLALPIILGMLAHTLVQLTDCWMLGHYGTLELASSAFGMRLVTLILYIGIGFGQAVSALSSEALGAANPRHARDIYRLGAWATFAFAAVGMGVAVAILPVYDHLGQPEMVAAWAKPYSLLIAASFIPALFFQTLRNYYEALKRPWVPFAFLFAMVGVNVFFNWVLIWGNLGAPRMGLIGSGVGTILARTLTALAFWGWAHTQSGPLHAAPQRALPFFELPRVLKIAVTAGLGMVATTAAYIVGSFWIGHFGATAISASYITGMVDNAIYMIPLGISFALTVRLGHAKGARDAESMTPIFRGGVWAVLVTGGLTALATVIWRNPIVGTFSPDPIIWAAAAPMMIIASFLRVFDHLSILAMGALRGLADVVVPVIIYLGAYWFIGLPAGYWMCFKGELGATGVWLGYLVCIVLAGTFLTARANWTIGELKKSFATPPR